MRRSQENHECTVAIGVASTTLKNLFDEKGFPKPFSRRPRMTVYRRELYDYAECLNIAVLLWGRFPKLDETLSRLIELNGWQQANGSFRARQLLLGWDNTPMHRWAQSQCLEACASSFITVPSVRSPRLTRLTSPHRHEANQIYVRNLRTI